MLDMIDLPSDVAQITDPAFSVAYANDDPAVAPEPSSRLLPSVMGQAERMLPDRAEAEDVAQEAMMRLWRNSSTSYFEASILSRRTIRFVETISMINILPDILQSLSDGSSIANLTMIN